MSTTIVQIAKSLGVSTITVSRALNNRGYYIKKETKEKILKKAAELNYRPNHIARSLRIRSTHAIGLILPDIKNPFFPNVASSINKIANSREYNVILCSSEGGINKEKSEVSTLLNRRVDGLIIIPSDCNNGSDTYKQLKETNIPFVLMDRYWRNINCSYVVCNDIYGAYLATSYLIKLGHKRIAHFSGSMIVTSAENRLKGYKKALEEYEIPYSEELVIETDVTQESGTRAMEIILEQKENPTAIFAWNDTVAIGAMQAIKSKGLKIPEDISLVGFDDIDVSSLLYVPLTTIHQPQDELGETSAKILFEQIENKENPQIKQILLEPELVVRNSCKEVTQ